MKRTKKAESLPELIQANDGVRMALDALIRGLTAQRTYSQNGQARTEPDNATQVKAAQTILEFSAAKPRASAKDEKPPDKRTEAEKTAEIVRILGIE